MSQNKLAALAFAASLIASVIYVIGYVNQPLKPCEKDNDFGRSWHGQRCIPYCPPDPSECG